MKHDYKSHPITLFFTNKGLMCGHHDIPPKNVGLKIYRV